jgi:hypothetical protein
MARTTRAMWEIGLATAFQLFLHSINRGAGFGNGFFKLLR